MLRKPNGQWTTNSEEVYQHLLETHFPGCLIDGCEDAVVNAANRAKPIWMPAAGINTLDQIVSNDRIKWAISTMAPFKSPGIDGMYPVLLQKGIHHLVYPLQKIYRESLVSGYIPQVWRTAKVTFIPKPGKPDYTVAKAFRPICLTSFLLKGLEKLVDRYTYVADL